MVKLLVEVVHITARSRSFAVCTRTVISLSRRKHYRGNIVFSQIISGPIFLLWASVISQNHFCQSVTFQMTAELCGHCHWFWNIFPVEKKKLKTMKTETQVFSPKTQNSSNRSLKKSYLWTRDNCCYYGLVRWEGRGRVILGRLGRPCWLVPTIVPRS